MLRPVTMSQAKILFLNNDSELVMDSLQEHGAFHLSLREAEVIATSELSYKVQDLIARLKDLLGRASLLLADTENSSTSVPTMPLESPDWPSFLTMVDEEISIFEKRVQGIEADMTKAATGRPLYALWSGLASSDEGRTSLSYLGAFKKLTPFLLRTDSESPGDLEEVLPEPSLSFTVMEDPRIVMVICLAEAKPQALQAASERGYSPLQSLEGMSGDLSSIEKFIKSYEEGMKRGEAVTKEAKLSLSGNMPRMRQISSVLTDAYSIFSIKEKSSVGGQWSVIEGYVPSKRGDSLINELNIRLNGRMIYSLKEEHSSPKVPVTFKYPKFFGLFHTITNLYGTPNYNEINPTPFLALTFPIFFGMMFGDIGHGLMLAALGFLIYKFVKSLSKIGKYLIICGIFGSIMGAILYGEAFGLHIFPGLITPSGVEEDIMLLLTFTLVVGVFQISLGMALGIVNNFIQKKKVDAILVGLPRMALYFVAILVIVLYGLDLTNWIGLPLYMILIPLFTFMLAKPIYEFAKHGLKKGISALGEMGFETFDTLIRFISNTVSYLRIFAMVVAHVMLTMVFYILGEMVGGGVMGIAIAVLGNIFVVLLEAIIVLAQDLRLHFYEWFSRFYDDSGVAFSPFRLSNDIPVIKK